MCCRSRAIDAAPLNTPTTILLPILDENSVVIMDNIPPKFISNFILFKSDQCNWIYVNIVDIFFIQKFIFFFMFGQFSISDIEKLIIIFKKLVKSEHTVLIIDRQL